MQFYDPSIFFRGKTLRLSAILLSIFNGNVCIADTYNGKIKLYNTKNNTITTIISGLNEPNGMIVIVMNYG
ncbi:MAG TPA: hypothetical protein VGI82_14930 [Chitinophagaceae bacterium]